jgi:hypothetical protein
MPPFRGNVLDSGGIDLDADTDFSKGVGTAHSPSFDPIFHRGVFFWGGHRPFFRSSSRLTCVALMTFREVVLENMNSQDKLV